MTTGVRFLITMAIVLAALLGLSLCGYNYWEPAPQKDALLDYMLASAESRSVEIPMCMDEQTRERIRETMMDGLDQALKDHVVRMFEVWMKDDRGQPDRARAGMRQGMRAYLDARRGASDWMPPACPG